MSWNSNRSICVVFAAFSLATVACVPNPSTQRPEEIKFASAFDRMTAHGKRVLYVDCCWNGDVIHFGKVFRKFAESRPDLRTLTVVHCETEGELWTRIKKLWDDNGIESGGSKNLNGAGLVVWFEDGNVVDYEWGQNLNETSLQERTAKAWK